LNEEAAMAHDEISPPALNKSRSRVRPEWVVAAVTVVLAAWVTTRSLGARSLWIDEILTRTYSHQSLGGLFLFFIHGELNMALYHFLLHFWLRLGDSEAVIRSLSVIFGLAALPLAYGLGARLLSRRAGALATVLLALNGAFYSFSREARSYSLTILLVIAASFFFVRALERGRRADWFAYVATAVLAVYAHLFAISVLFAHLVSLAFWRGRPIDRRRAGPAAAALVALLSPAVAYVVTADQSLTNDTTTRLRDVVDLFRWYATGNRPLLFVYVLGALAAAFAAIRRSLRTDSIPWPEAFLAVWVAVPIVVALAISYTIDPIFESRYLLVALPALILLVADGIALAAPVGVFLVLAVGASAVSARSLDLCRPGCATPTQDFRSATAYIRSRAGAGDEIRFDPSYLAFAYEYYDRRIHETTTRQERVRSSPNGNRNPARAWLLVDEGDPKSLRYGGIDRPLGTQWRLVDVNRLNRLVIELYVRRP
jgi:mannosyltransferase